MTTKHKVQWPCPRGPNPVGFAEFMVTDPNRAAHHAPEPMLRRDLLALAWYPAANIAGKECRRYMDARDVQNGGHASFNLYQITAAEQAHLQTIETAAFVNAPVAAGHFPLLVFCHGSFSFPQQNTVLMEHLASHGYIVVSVAHPFESATHFLPDGRRLEMDQGMWSEMLPLFTLPQNLDAYFDADLTKRREAVAYMITWMRGTCLARLAHDWTEDLVHVADRLAQGNLPAHVVDIAAAADMNHMGYFGMSFGGHVAALCCLSDPRARAGVNLDGGLFTAEPLDRELGLPFLAFTGDLSVAAAMIGRTATPPTPEGPTLLDFAYERADGVEPAHPLLRLGVRGTKHHDFADLPLLFDPSTVPALASNMPLERWFDLKTRVVTEFFDRYVRGLGLEFPGRLAQEFADLLVVHEPRRRTQSVQISHRGRN